MKSICVTAAAAAAARSPMDRYSSIVFTINGIWWPKLSDEILWCGFGKCDIDRRVRSSNHFKLSSPKDIEFLDLIHRRLPILPS